MEPEMTTLLLNSPDDLDTLVDAVEGAIETRKDDDEDTADYEAILTALESAVGGTFPFSVNTDALSVDQLVLLDETVADLLDRESDFKASI